METSERYGSIELTAVVSTIADSGTIFPWNAVSNLTTRLLQWCNLLPPGSGVKVVLSLLFSKTRKRSLLFTCLLYCPRIYPVIRKEKSSAMEVRQLNTAREHQPPVPVPQNSWPGTGLGIHKLCQSQNFLSMPSQSSVCRCFINLL